MQTFLPYPDYDDSAKVLDRQRLGKQRVENFQIMRALLLGQGWVNHPATLMWKGYEWSLLHYHAAITQEWVERGYKDTTWKKTSNLYFNHREPLIATFSPPWVGDTDVHRSHQSNLLRKNPEHYGPYFPGVPDDLPYVWPEPDEEQKWKSANSITIG